MNETSPPGPDGSRPPSADAASQPGSAAALPQGALLTDNQIKRLKVAIFAMSALLVIGVVTLIGRVIYLASARGDGAPSLPNAPLSAPLLGDLKINLPSGAQLKTASLQGHRLLAHYAGPRGDGLLVVDLVTGKTVSHVRLEPAP